ncbi:carbon-monoxide dehydrogenase medium subunit [Thermocatellispora tengchongensis]|uniref:Carbon-monoxide dehydrogenase medium subunit n=1 Tax=Thermocatellispora tengchongensis TaxID=1073253 RepID=A0A840PPF9_9ACTN|nr:FAD binding domain-containing protein [Thermocatellispora tengchongensis]MBB5137905.1 carbon-monoxide dehydrogenase medium subunit [Thermocatellispora tengchongensis]
MKPAVFAYHRPTEVAEALAILDAYGGQARVLAGGQSLMPLLNMRLLRPEALIDINDIDDLDQVLLEGDRTVLGALVRYTTVERTLAARLPLLAEAITHVGDRQVRNRGTVGGALAQGDPTGELPLACLVLDAVVVVRGAAGVRRIPVREFYEGPYATVLGPAEMVVAAEFPRPPAHHAFGEICRRHNDFAVVAVAAAGDRRPDGTWHDVRLGVGGVADTPLRIPAAERALEGTRLAEEDLRAAAGEVEGAIDPPDDVRASAEYRRHLTGVQVMRVLGRLRAEGEK